MRVGIYVDGFNLYYGGRGICGRGTAGWRWLDIRAMVEPFVGWAGAVIDKVVYFTARVDQTETPSSWIDQDAYIAALLASGSVTHVEEGRYVSWAKAGPLVANAHAGAHPVLHKVTGNELLDPTLPLTVSNDPHVGKVILATVRRREEKGSDVNVASHLLKDVLTGAVDAAVVITNDSDLGLPLTMAREVVPVGTVNPQPGYLAGALRGLPTDGVGRHWWCQLTVRDFTANQLPDPVGPHRKPSDW